MSEKIEDGDVVEMDEVHYGKRCYYPVVEYHPNTGSIAYEKEQLTKATYSVLVHDSNVSRVFIEKGKHFQLMRKIIESNNELIKEKDREIMNLKADSCYIEAARAKQTIREQEKQIEDGRKTIAELKEARNYLRVCNDGNLNAAHALKKEIAELKAETERLKPYEKHVLERKKWAEEFHKKYD